MARATASASIAFGMVNVPVKLFTASSSTQVKFKMLSPEGGSLKQQYVDADGEVVARSEMLKGFEFAKGQYVTFTPEEIKALDAQSDNQISITEFVPMASVDPLYLDKAYYLAPDKGGDRAYHLLAAALRETNLCGVARYAARGKQYLVLLRAVSEGIVLQQCLHAEDVRPIAGAEIPEADVNEAELAMAKQLVQSLAQDAFDPTKHSDEVRARVEELIQQKVAGEEITVPDAEAPKGQVLDLMASLKASLSGDAQDDAAERKPAKKATPKAKAKKSA